MNPNTYFFILCFALAGCAPTTPILYPNERFQAVGKIAAQRDIDMCIELAESAGADSGSGSAGQAVTNTVGGAAIGAASGAIGGAIVGSVGSGSAIGAATGATAGLIHWLFSKPERSPAFENFVNQCLTDRGYKPVGWD
jgi:outer membrane lipoprotein SlyB